MTRLVIILVSVLMAGCCSTYPTVEAYEAAEATMPEMCRLSKSDLASIKARTRADDGSAGVIAAMPTWF